MLLINYFNFNKNLFFIELNCFILFNIALLVVYFSLFLIFFLEELKKKSSLLNSFIYCMPIEVLDIFSFFDFSSPITFEMKSVLIAFYDIVYLLIIVLVFVMWFLYKMVYNFYYKNKGIRIKNTNSIHYSHKFLGFKIIPSSNFFIEFIWTIIPMFLFYIIYLPVYKLLSIYGFDDYYYRLFILNDNELYYTDFWGFLWGNVHWLEDLWLVDSTILYKTSLSEVPISIKVIGNQWYWMYESSINDIFSKNWDIPEVFESEILTSYLVNFDFLKTNYEDFNINSSFCLIDNDSYSKLIRLLSTDFYLSFKINEQINFFISSYDVIHNWCIPAAGIKIDACPGRLASVKTCFNETGFFYGQCSELCGFLHGFMPISIFIYK